MLFLQLNVNQNTAGAVDDNDGCGDFDKDNNDDGDVNNNEDDDGEKDDEDNDDSYFVNTD